MYFGIVFEKKNKKNHKKKQIWLLTLNDFHSSWTNSKNDTALAAAITPTKTINTFILSICKLINEKIIKNLLQIIMNRLQLV